MLNDDTDKSNLSAEFKEHFKQQQCAKNISWEKINSDKFDLLKETAKLKIFRDKWIAHIDQKRKQVTIEYDELSRVVDLLNTKIQEYYTLLTTSSMPSLLASGMEEDEEVFNFVWRAE